MSPEIDQCLYTFRGNLTSYLEEHPSSKYLNFGRKCPTKELIQATVNLFARKSFSETNIRNGQIENDIDNLFLKYRDHPNMESVKILLTTALEDNLRGINIEDLNKKVASTVVSKNAFDGPNAVCNNRKRKTSSDTSNEFPKYEGHFC